MGDWESKLKELFEKTDKALALEIPEDIDLELFNLRARNMTVNVSYCGRKVLLGKKLDNVIFSLDDFHENNHKLELLHDLKKRFPKLKVTLFTIPSMCSVKWLKSVKEDWMEFAVHGYYHNVTNRIYDDGSFYPEECLNWTKEDAHKYLEKAEKMGVFIKGFKAPGWGMNTATYEVLKERGYWVMDNKDRTHERPSWVDFNYESGHMWEVNGHIQETPFNGLGTLNKKLNFLPDSEFYFISEIVGTDKNNERLCHYQDRIVFQPL